VSVVGVSRYGLACGISLDERVIALILKTMIVGLLKAVLNWTVLAHPSAHRLRCCLRLEVFGSRISDDDKISPYAESVFAEGW